MGKAGAQSCHRHLPFQMKLEFSLWESCPSSGHRSICCSFPALPNPNRSGVGPGKLYLNKLPQEIPMVGDG